MTVRAAQSFRHSTVSRCVTSKREAAADADAVGALDDVDPYTARRLMDAHRQGYRQASGMEVAR